MIDSSLLSLLNKHYGLVDFTIEEQLRTNGSRLAYRILTPSGRLVLKLTDHGRPEEIVRSDTGILAYLEQFNFPAPRMLRALDGSLFLPFEDRYFYLYHYLPGRPPVATLEYYLQLGRLLATLHALPVQDEARVSLHRPAYLLSDIRELVSQAPDDPAQQAMKAEIIEMLDAFPSFEGLPEGLIHTDPYFINVVQAEPPSGDFGGLALIDWEDAGISYPLIDVGYVGHLVTFLPNDRKNWQVLGEGSITCRFDYAQAFLDAYQSVRPLSALEKDLFAAAVRLNFLEYIWEWGERRIIPENFERMKLLEGFHPRW